MVNISALKLSPLLRLLSHRIKTGAWRELRQVFAHGALSRAPHARTAAGLLFNRGDSHQPPALFQMASAYWISQAIYVAAKLGMADIIADSPKSCEEIARAARADEDSLHRLMRVLCMLGVCRVTDSGKFALTEFGKPLQSEISGSMRSMVLTLGEVHYRAWGRLCESVQSGDPGFPMVFGADMFQFLEHNSEAGDVFNLAMTDYSAFVACAVLLSYDFSGIKSIVDVGGGHGTLMTGILEVYPKLCGVLVDLPSVIRAAKEGIESHPCSHRCAAIALNFLDSLPHGADVYLLSGVIHDWNDEAARRILRNCRVGMGKTAKLLVVECVMPAGNEPSFSKLLDLNMMVMTGGRERTEREFRELLDDAGLKLNRIIPTVSPLSILEAVPA
jgi:hypothetical protein